MTPMLPDLSEFLLPTCEGLGRRFPLTSCICFTHSRRRTTPSSLFLLQTWGRRCVRVMGCACGCGWGGGRAHSQHGREVRQQPQGSAPRSLHLLSEGGNPLARPAGPRLPAAFPSGPPISQHWDYRHHAWLRMKFLELQLRSSHVGHKRFTN